jgi:transposase-like protein
VCDSYPPRCCHIALCEGSDAGKRWESADLQEIVQLKREVIRLKAERDILKKAAAYFAREST